MNNFKQKIFALVKKTGFLFKKEWLVKNLVLIFLVLICLLVAIWPYFKKVQEKNKAITVKEITLATYKSRGSRDQNKVETKEFKTKESIQVKITFNNAKEGTVVAVGVYKLKESAGEKDDENKEEKQKLEIPLQKDGERFISVLPDLPAGKYLITIEQGGFELAKSEFEIL